MHANEIVRVSKNAKLENADERSIDQINSSSMHFRAMFSWNLIFRSEEGGALGWGWGLRPRWVG